MKQHSNAIYVRDILAVVFKYKRMIVALVALTLAVVVTFAYWFPERFDSSSKILIKPGRQNSQMGVVESPLRAQITTNTLRKEDITTEAEILASRPLIEKALADVGEAVMSPPLTPGDSLWSETKYWIKSAGRGLADFFRATLVFLGLTVETTEHQRLVLALEKNLKVLPVHNSDVIEVRFTWPSPEAAAAFVNSLVGFYIEQHVRVHKEEDFYGFMRSETDRTRERLQEIEAEIAVFKKKYGIVDLAEQRTLLLKQQNSLDTALRVASESVAEHRSRLATVSSKIEADREVLVVGEGDGRNPVIDHLRLRIATLDLEEQDIKRRYEEGSVVVEQKRQVTEETKLRLAQEIDVARQAAEGATPSSYARLREEKHRHDVELKGAQAREQELMRQLKQVTRNLEELNSKENELIQLSREQKAVEGQLALYMVKQDELRLAEVMDQRRITSVAVINGAGVPIQPVRMISLLPNRIFFLLAGLLGSLIGGAALAFVRDYLDRTLDTVRKVEIAAGAPVLGSLPFMDNIARDGPARLSWVSERLSTDTRFILVCGVTRGDGASTVAAVIAEGFVHERGKRVLLVDCNFRDQPGPLLALPNSPGLFDVPSAELKSVVIESRISGLSVIPRGAKNGNPTAMFEQAGFLDAMSELARDFDYTILDVPAILSHPDALVLGRLGLDAIVVVDSSRTRVEALEEAIKRLHSSGARIAGAVMNFRRYYIPDSLYNRF